MPIGNAQNFDRLVEFLKQKRENVTFGDIVTLAEIATQSAQTFFQSIDAAVYHELREIAGYIDKMRLEIGVLQANEIKESRIPAAGEELDAIIEATEKATHCIMECAEAVIAADAGDPQAYKTFVDEQMMTVFEACSFQDITGQRVAKVVETLRHIEERVARFADVMQAKDLDGFIDQGDRERAERKERLMLNGPQIDGRGNAQSAIDSLLGGDASAVTKQSAIDHLFD